MKKYLVGGYIRDKFLGIESKDIDFAVEATSFEEMKQELLRTKHKIYLEKPEFGSIRAHSPEWGAVDYTLCRSDGTYSDGRHPDSIEIGDIYTDLSRRDFSINAIAYNIETEEYIDPFDGRKHIESRRLHCVGKAPVDENINMWRNADERFNEDKLRILRAFRFMVTKDFRPNDAISYYLSTLSNHNILESVSNDRIREELAKCFKFNTTKTLHSLSFYLAPRSISYLFEQSGIWLEPTQRAR